MFDPDLLAVDRHLGPTMAYIHEGEELIDREETRDPVAKLPRDIAGIIRKRFGGVAGLPSALVLERLRQVPVVERRKRFDAGFEQRIDQAAVEVETLRIRLTDAVGKDSRPGDREPIALDAHVLHEPHIILVAMIMIVGDIGVVAVPDLARRMRVAIPDRGAATVFPYGALDLKRRRGDAPGEAVRKPGCALHRFRPAFCRG